MLGTDDPRPTGEGAIVLPLPHLLPQLDQQLSAEGLDRLVQVAFDGQESSFRRTAAKLARYGATSIICFGVSEVVLLVTAALGVTATLAAAIGTISGVIPSYLLSRYWIWADAKRDRAGRQVALYWIISGFALVITSLTTGGVSDAAPPSGALHLIAVGGGFLIINAVCWVGKYVLYQRYIFVSDVPAPG